MVTYPAEPLAVTVLLTVYRRTEYLDQALASVLAQTFGRFEVLVVDDSNSPEIATIVAAVGDPRVRYRPNPTNLGISISLREAWPAAGGRYVAILNDDDAWEPTFLERLVAPLEADPGRGLAFCDFWTMDETGKIDPRRSEEFSKTWGRAALPPGEVEDFPDFALVKMGVPLAMGSLIRKSAVDPSDFVPEVSGAYDFWIACLLASKGTRAFFVKERLSRYRMHAAMESERRAADKNVNLVFIYDALLRWDAFPPLRLLLRQRLAIAHRLVASDARQHGQRSAALRHARAALRLQPAIFAGRLLRLMRRRR